MRTLKNNPGVKFQVSVVTKRWLRDKFVKELQGTVNLEKNASLR